MRICAVSSREPEDSPVPAQPLWFLRLPEIIAEISTLEAPILDRAVVERVFRVRRRRAVEIMGAFGGYQVGRTFVVERQKMLAEIQRMRQSDEFQFECHRKTKLVQELDRARRVRAGAPVSIPIEKQDLERKAPDFPTGVELQPGRLTVVFGTAEELVQRLYGLAQMALHDFQAFKSTAETLKS